MIDILVDWFKKWLADEEVENPIRRIRRERLPKFVIDYHDENIVGSHDHYWTFETGSSQQILDEWEKESMGDFDLGLDLVEDDFNLEDHLFEDSISDTVGVDLDLDLGLDLTLEDDYSIFDDFEDWEEPFSSPPINKDELLKEIKDDLKKLNEKVNKLLGEGI